jgi:hypothetical protein
LVCAPLKIPGSFICAFLSALFVRFFSLYLRVSFRNICAFLFRFICAFLSAMFALHLRWVSVMRKPNPLITGRRLDE